MQVNESFFLQAEENLKSIDQAFILRFLAVFHKVSAVRILAEYFRWDPKKGDLCFDSMKLGETLVEVRICADVQIAFLYLGIGAKD